MSKYEVSNVKSGHSFGVFEADGADAAIEALCKDAGYDSKADAEAVMGHEAELIAVEVEAWEAWEDGGERVSFYVPVAESVDIAEAGAAALGVEVTEALNVSRA